jgi:enoyl-CoA hydratase
MSFENLLVERDGAVAIVTINRPKVLNALNSQTLDEIRRVILELKRDETIRAVVLTGAGDKSFVAGADISELAVQTPTGGKEHAHQGQHVLNLIESMGKPVIAAINGFCLGGGCELAMACTLRIAADTARIGQPEINLGLIPGFAGSQRLARLVGKGRALEMILTGAPITAAEAWRIGLINRVVPAAELLTAARKLAAELASKAPLAVRYAIEATNKGLEMTQAEGAFLETTLFGLIASTEDMREGTRAFLEKRKPEFKGK